MTHARLGVAVVSGVTAGGGDTNAFPTGTIR
jgi:hypothetical protein